MWISLFIYLSIQGCNRNACLSSLYRHNNTVKWIYNKVSYRPRKEDALESGAPAVDTPVSVVRQQQGALAAAWWALSFSALQGVRRCVTSLIYIILNDVVGAFSHLLQNLPVLGHVSC